MEGERSDVMERERGRGEVMLWREREEEEK